jgi:hypothetical protein
VDYSILEEDFDCACGDVVKDLSKQYKLTYQAGGPGMLDAFLQLVKAEFEKAELTFIEKFNISGDAEALRRIKTIARKRAKKCVEDYGKVVM